MSFCRYHGSHPSGFCPKCEGPAAPFHAWKTYRATLRGCGEILPEWKHTPRVIRTAWIAGLTTRFDPEASWQTYRRTLHYQQIESSPEAFALPVWNALPMCVRAAFTAAFHSLPAQR